MKTLSIFIICITLMIFYKLAVDQQNKIAVKQHKIDAIEKNINSVGNQYYADPYFHFEDEFSMHVTGKEHRFLNKGISYIEQTFENEKKHVTVAQTDDQESSFSGS